MKNVLMVFNNLNDSLWAQTEYIPAMIVVKYKRDVLPNFNFVLYINSYDPVFHISMLK